MEELICIFWWDVLQLEQLIITPRFNFPFISRYLQLLSFFCSYLSFGNLLRGFWAISRFLLSSVVWHLFFREQLLGLGDTRNVSRSVGRHPTVCIWFGWSRRRVFVGSTLIVFLVLFFFTDRRSTTDLLIRFRDFVFCLLLRTKLNFQKRGLIFKRIITEKVSTKHVLKCNTVDGLTFHRD